MNEKVKVKFIRYKNAVLMEVLEMPEKYRGKGVLTEQNRPFIASVCCPGICYDSLYLRGEDRSKDNYVSSLDFEDEEQAVKNIECFAELIRKLNGGDIKSETKSLKICGYGSTGDTVIYITV